jgi:hypothetical protein
MLLKYIVLKAYVLEEEYIIERGVVRQTKVGQKWFGFNHRFFFAVQAVLFFINLKGHHPLIF